uniref:Carbonic anhydrase n=1 Tax=Eptatretus burgeri TaxID=7764 RepID=A0A8C4NJ48_EPTBU
MELTVVSQSDIRTVVTSLRQALFTSQSESTVLAVSYHWCFKRGYSSAFLAVIILLSGLTTVNTMFTGGLRFLRLGHRLCSFKHARFLLRGPHTWVHQFPIAQSSRQSPVDLRSSETHFDAKLQPLNYDDKATSSRMLNNNGLSFKLSFDDSSDPCVLNGGPLDGDFRLNQLHMHWGCDKLPGSEHIVDGNAYAAELHMVHWNSSKYSSMQQAVTQPDGLAVIGVFIQGSKIELSGLNPLLLLPSSTAYWTYLGSLTTPPLHESVTWIVMKEPLSISKQQLKAIQSLYFLRSGKYERLLNNNRPPQPLAGRKIRASFK